MSGAHQMSSNLLFHPGFDHREATTRIADPKVVHPAPEDRIDLLNHFPYRLADAMPEYFLDLPKQRSPLLQLGRIVWSPLLVTAQNAAKFEAQEGKALSLFHVHHPTLVLVDLHPQFRQLLSQPSFHPPHHPVIPRMSVNQNHQVVRKSLPSDPPPTGGHAFRTLPRSVDPQSDQAAVSGRTTVDGHPIVEPGDHSFL